ncbi:MAG TPA: fatty acid--CoA ligase [Haliangiales bacterium]|nr:fatty acid--CoA ligase [Haliangiales bacterium]
MRVSDYPLLIKNLLLVPTRQPTRNHISYRDVSRYDYATFGERVARLGSALARLGVKPGDTVAVMDWDTPRFLECFFAVPMLGAVLQTVNVRLSPEQVRYTMDHAGASVVLCNVEFQPLLESVRAELPQLKKLVCMTDVGTVPSGGAWDGEYEQLLAGGDPAHEFPDFDENTRATTFYTTGTTGNPKGVYFSHRQLVLHTLAALYTLQITPRDVYMPITPMFHVHAWGLPYAATAAGIKQVYPGRYLPDLLCKLVLDEKVTLSHCVPTVLRMILNCPSAQGRKFSGWRMLIGGSALPGALCQEALERGIDVCGGYGMSETGPVLSVSRIQPELSGDPAAELSYRVKAGLPIPLVDLRIVDPNMRDVPHDGVASGEVVVRAPWLTRGYHHDDRASETLWSGGYLHTQDIGTIDPHGYLLITDRIKDVIKTGGEWVSSLQLEDIIAHHASVAEVAVIGVPDAKWGERPLAIIVPRPGSVPDPADLKAHILKHVERGEISKYAVPETFVMVEALDKTSVGKLDKKLLRQKYGAAQPASK